MKRFTIAGTFAVIASISCAVATAQTRFCTGGDLSQLTQSQRQSCEAKLRAVREVASTLRTPADWHFIVVCGEAGWQSYAAFASEANTEIAGAFADTNLLTHETFLRESRLQDHGPDSVQSVVAKEVAQILLHSRGTVATAPKADIALAPGRVKTGL